MANLDFPSSSSVGQVYTANGKSWTWNGLAWTASLNASVNSSITNIIDTFTGNGSNTQFTLSQSSTTNNTIVTLQGVAQIPSQAYTISDTTLTMSEVIPSGQKLVATTPTVYNVYGAANAFKTFYFTGTAGQTTISGTDNNSQLMNYTPGVIMVFINGFKMVPGSDYTATDGSTITISSALALGDVVEVVTFSSLTVTPPVSTAATVPNISIGSIAYETVSTVTTNSTSQVSLDTLDASVYRSAKYLVQVTDTTNNLYHFTEIMLMHNGSIVFSTEFSTVYSSVSLINIDASIAGSSLFLLGTPTNPNNTIKIYRIALYA